MSKGNESFYRRDSLLEVKQRFREALKSNEIIDQITAQDLFVSVVGQNLELKPGFGTYHVRRMEETDLAQTEMILRLWYNVFVAETKLGFPAEQMVEEYITEMRSIVTRKVAGKMFVSEALVRSVDSADEYLPTVVTMAGLKPTIDPWIVRQIEIERNKEFGVDLPGVEMLVMLERLYGLPARFKLGDTQGETNPPSRVLPLFTAMMTDLHDEGRLGAVGLTRSAIWKKTNQTYDQYPKQFIFFGEKDMEDPWETRALFLPVQAWTASSLG